MINQLLRADIITKASILRKQHPELRKGQSIFIISEATDSLKSRKYIATDVDCFYDDRNIDSFLDSFCAE